MMAKASPAEFVRQVRQETSKVTWPSRKETGMTTAMVFVMAALAAIFFLIIDKIITFGIEFILGLGG
jgi:preprotein translocase subunit SecE|tara:strand:- start:293 stop:493 length:201 start_codon:yes stop_codon:yes gene_type:complete